MVFYKSVGQTENGLEHSFVKHWLNAISLYVLRVVTKISSCRVNTTSRRGNQTASDFFWFYFSSIFQ